MPHIQKIKLKNFKRFQAFEVAFDENMNLLIGDNEAGKSSVLSAIDLAVSGSRFKVESAGLDNLFNVDAIQNFLKGEKNYEDLPTLVVELYLNETNNENLNGNANSDGVVCDGIRLECVPNDELSEEIKEILGQNESNFPFEFYLIKFSTFKNSSFSSYQKYLKHVLIDSSKVNSEYAMREYVKDMYSAYTTGVEKNQYANEYRKHKESFKETTLSELNQKLKDYSFSIRNNIKANLETDLTLTEGPISLENKGNGKQTMIKTEFALRRTSSNLDVILIEEPENNLSHTNMKNLIHGIQETHDKQLFVATHSDLISSRLDLRKSIFLNSNDTSAVLLDSLSEDTAKFFMKAPDNNILQFIMSKKVILVEGDAEYILMEALFRNATGSDLSSTDVHVISVGGISFKRYLEIATILNIKTAVVRDNDGAYQENCVDNYADFVSDSIQVFADLDDERNTFEVCVYQDNKVLCDALFDSRLKTRTVEQYMLAEKANVAFELLESSNKNLIVPDYLKIACLWIRE